MTGSLYLRARAELRQAVEGQSDAILTDLIVTAFGPSQVDERHLVEWHIQLHMSKPHPACRLCAQADTGQHPHDWLTQAGEQDLDDALADTALALTTGAMRQTMERAFEDFERPEAGVERALDRFIPDEPLGCGGAA